MTTRILSLSESRLVSDKSSLQHTGSWDGENHLFIHLGMARRMGGFFIYLYLVTRLGETHTNSRCTLQKPPVGAAVRLF